MVFPWSGIDLQALWALIWRLVRIRLGTAAIIALPCAALPLWYAWSAWAELDRYHRATDPAVDIDLELFHIALHDTLRRDLRRMMLPERPERSKLPTFEIAIGRAALDDLNAQLFREGKSSYVQAFLRKGGQSYDIGVRYRGKQHWHWLLQQKSLKIRLERGDLLDGARIFNLINDVTPFGLEDQLILDLARELGLLTPEYRPVWLRLNNADMGVYRYVAQATEGLLRRAGRMPGSIFSGNSDRKNADGVAALFDDTSGWKQVARRSGIDKEDESLVELERLIAAINTASFARFAAFAADELDLDKLARFDALDVVFGGDQHDYAANHKLYYDAYTGRFEPIAWNFRGFKHSERFNLVDNPLLVRLKMTPGYLELRDRLVYDLLIDTASVPSMRQRVDIAFTELEPDLAADPYWDAYKLLPRVSRFHRFMVRPMTRDRWLLRAQDELQQYARRNRWLLDELERPGLAITAGRDADAEGRDLLVVVDVTVDGHSAWALRGLEVAGACTKVSLAADADLDGRYDPRRDRLLATGRGGERLVPHGYDELTAGVELAARPDARPKRGAVWVERTAQTYRYFIIAAGCVPSGGALELENLVTGVTTRRRIELAARPLAPRATPPELPIAAVPHLRAGVRAPHRWRYPRAPDATRVRLGPGRVTIDVTRVFAAHETVEIAAGTRLELGPGVSLIFRGPLYARGTAAAPIEIVPADPRRPFGGVALQGVGTAGAHLRHVRLWGGTRPAHLAIDYPGLLNIQDTHDILLEQVELIGSGGDGDLLHATYVDGLRLYEITTRRAPKDGIDLEFVTGELRGVRVFDSGDDCLDLMGTTIRLTDSTLIGCHDNGITAGEKSRVAARGVLVADSGVAILSKNASDVRLTKSLVYRAELALRTNRREVHHAGASTIGAEDFFAVDCKKVRARAKGTRLDAGNVRSELPTDAVLDHLRGSVLGLDAWSELDSALVRMRQ